PMTVDVVAAQTALLASIEDGHGHRFGFSEGKFLKFVLTVGIIYHAYEVSADEIPAQIKVALAARA
ncbi:MAG: hypothetical protein ACTHOH_02615, partial [Lysobacteraceae bacterium]